MIKENKEKKWEKSEENRRKKSWFRGKRFLEREAIKAKLICSLGPEVLMFTL